MENTIILNTMNDYLMAYDNEVSRLEEIVNDVDVEHLVNENCDCIELNKYLKGLIDIDYDNRLQGNDLDYMQNTYSNIYDYDLSSAVAYAVSSDITMRINFNREFI